jgi:hypothetical protein
LCRCARVRQREQRRWFKRGLSRPLSERQIEIVAEAYEIHQAVVIDDVGVVFTWDEPTDDLVAWLSQRHSWRAKEAVSYLTVMEKLRLGYTACPPDPLARAPGSEGGCQGAAGEHSDP